jgi:hypothetical protein
VLAPGSDDTGEEASESPARRSPYLRILIGGAVAAVVWLVLPAVPRDQTIVFDLGKNGQSVAQLDVHWQSPESDHQGKLTLNFPAPTPERVVRQFRMTDGPYAFRITAVRRDATRSRTEVVRQVTLDGNSLTLNLDELSP